MKNRKIFIMPLSFILVLSIYYLFFDTLSITQVVGKQSSPEITILLNVFDFDTGLTRYDVYVISKDSSYWSSRIREVELISDRELRTKEETKLLAEMMEDPSLRKIVRKIVGFGGKASLSILNGLLGL